MRASRRSAVYRVFSAAVIALLLIALLSGNALAAGTDGLTVETLTFRDVLALYAADRDSFGENASETDGDGVTNAAKRLAEMFTFTVGLNYAGEGLNCNYFGKDISAQMGAEPYTDANRLASYDVEILPYRSYAVALPQGQTTTISVYLAGYTNAAASGGVEAVLHYVWQDQGVWYAVKDDNPYYRIRFNGKSARALAADGLAMALAHAENGTAAIGAWENLSAMPDGNGAATLADGTLLAGQGSANLIGVTNDISALSAGSLSHSLLAVSDFLRGDTTYQTGPLVHKRDCFEAGTLHRVPDGEALREGVTYEFRVQYAEALSVAAGMRSEDAGLAVRSELTGEEFPVSDFVWYGSSEHLTGDEYNPYTITFTYTPSSEGSTVCSFAPVNLTGESSALSAALYVWNSGMESGNAVARVLSGKCNINGKDVEKIVDVRASLTDMLRNDFRLTSVKKGCEVGECGACTALIDGEAINTCLYLAVWAEGKHIITLEGLMNPDGTVSDVQKAFMEETSIQCGFCIPGFILTATEIVNSGKEYTDDELRKLLSGHLCRCTGYQNILNAVERAVNECSKLVGREDA